MTALDHRQFAFPFPVTANPRRETPIMRIIVKKGKPPARACPPDFDVIFVEQGRLECESWYHARKTTITRWLVERGKERLIAKRAAYVASLRRQGKWITRGTNMTERRKVKPQQPRIQTRKVAKVDPRLAAAAADYLRISRNGGWRISRIVEGQWRVGVSVKTAIEMVGMAERAGFDRRAVAAQIDSTPPVAATGARNGPVGYPGTSGREKCAGGA